MTDVELAALVRRADPDRFLGALFAPPALRRDLLALFAFNHELARARAVASTPPLALIRLQWWREIIEGEIRAHPIAALMRDGMDRGVFDSTMLGALIDAREAEAEPIPDCAAFIAYARGTAGRLARIGGRVLGVTADAALAALEDIGTGYAIAAILRAGPALLATGRDLLPQDGTDPVTLLDHAAALLERSVPKSALAVALPAVLARRDLRALRHGAVPGLHPGPRGLGDRMAVMLAGVRGRC